MDFSSKDRLSTLAFQLNHLCDELNGLFDINWGGCCYVAYCLASLLEQDNIKFSIAVFDENVDLADYSSLLDLPDAMDHYGIVLEASNEMHPVNCDDKDFKLHSQLFKASAEEILLCYNTNHWNQRYDYRKNFPIKRLIEQAYHDFTQDLC